MPNGNAEKHILLVEDNEEHRKWFKGEFHTLEKEYQIVIHVTDAGSFKEVDDLVKSVKNGEQKFDCAVVDMQIPQDSTSETQIHWGTQALNEIKNILILDKILIVTAHKGDVMPHLSEPEKKRAFSKGIHLQVFRDAVAKMLGLKKAP
jgi:CheY-like chemotaxis protein